jgi:hypothetical protein
MSFDTELSSKRKTFLYLYQICPLIDVIHKIYDLKRRLENEDLIEWYVSIFPFRRSTNRIYMEWFAREYCVMSRISGSNWREFKDRARRLGRWQWGHIMPWALLPSHVTASEINLFIHRQSLIQHGQHGSVFKTISTMYDPDPNLVHNRMAISNVHYQCI